MTHATRRRNADLEISQDYGDADIESGTKRPSQKFSRTTKMIKKTAKKVLTENSDSILQG